MPVDRNRLVEREEIVFGDRHDLHRFKQIVARSLQRGEARRIFRRTRVIQFKVVEHRLLLRVGQVGVGFAVLRPAVNLQFAAGGIRHRVKQAVLFRLIFLRDAYGLFIHRHAERREHQLFFRVGKTVVFVQPT